MTVRQSPGLSGPGRGVRPLRLGIGIVVVLTLTAGSVPAQELELSPAGSVGLVILEKKPGLSLAAGGRLSAGLLRVTGVLDFSVVGWGTADGRYEWDLLSCRETSSDRNVSRSLCPDPEVRTGFMLDAAVVHDLDSDVRPLIGAGYRVGTVETAFGTIGVMGSFRSGYRWYGRFLIGDRFLQLHFGISIR